ncbi:MAG: ATP phosphoribosyltransferase regulatory subunit [Methylococcaceae bacterium]|nr:MAG: ATP phosphoribosyltransferase regulatory subunit [Methylococcaceae bacterium]
METAQRDRWLLPEGVEEVLPPEARQLERLRRRLLDLFQTWGYQLVIPPFIDYLDSLLTGTGRALDLQTFKVTDQLTGRMLGIRADMTPQVARLDAHHLKREAPTRLCYIDTVLLTRGDHLEKSRSPIQVGAELYGHQGSASDVEIIRLMLEVLAQAGVLDVHLDLGHVAIYRELVRLAGLTPDQEAALFEVLQRKAAMELNELLECAGVAEPMRSMLLGLPDLNGGAETLPRAREILAPAGAVVDAALCELATVLEQLRTRFPALPIHVDLAELRGYHYQTGIVFAAFLPGCGKEIARGGRYDEIGKVFGRARPATGFSADLKMLAQRGAQEETTQETVIFAPDSNDPALWETIRDLRADGKTVIEALPGQAGDAADLGCTQALEKTTAGWRSVPLARSLN